MKIFKQIIEMLKGFLRKILKIQKQLKKAKKAKKDLVMQAALVPKLENYIAGFLNGKIDKFVAIPKKPELTGKKIIWQFWQQGIDENTPKMVIACFNSVKKYCGEYEIILLSKETLHDYLDEFPDFVWEKFGRGGFTFPQIADLVRLCLLSAYGGIWLDASIYLTKPIEYNWLKKDFFVLQCSQTPPADVNLFTKFDPIGLSWDQASYVKMHNYFIIAKPHYKIIDDLLSLLFEYWKNEAQINHYFFFQLMFNRMMQYDEWKKLNCEIVCYSDSHRLQIAGFDRFDQKIYDEISALSGVHKLTLYWNKKKIPVNSFADVVINGKQIEKGGKKCL